MLKRTFINLAAALVPLVIPCEASATADGPDVWDVANVSPDTVLTLYEHHSTSSKKIGEVPHNGKRLRNLGCVRLLGGQVQPDVDGPPEGTYWCRVHYLGYEGWVQAAYLKDSETSKSADRYEVTGVALNDILNVRQAPTPRAGVVFQLAPNAGSLAVNDCVRGPEGCWCLIWDEKNASPQKRGWVNAKFIRPMEEPKPDGDPHLIVSCKYAAPTVYSLVGVDTSQAQAKARVTFADAAEYCGRDSGDATTRYEGQETLQQCTEGVLKAEANQEYVAEANCDSGHLSTLANSRAAKKGLVEYVIGRENAEVVWRSVGGEDVVDSSCASSGPPLMSQFRLLCPRKALNFELPIGAASAPALASIRRQGPPACSDQDVVARATEVVLKSIKQQLAMTSLQIGKFNAGQGEPEIELQAIRTSTDKSGNRACLARMALTIPYRDGRKPYKAGEGVAYSAEVTDAGDEVVVTLLRFF